MKENHLANNLNRKGNKPVSNDFYKSLQQKIRITKNLIGFTKSAFEMSVVSYKVKRANISTLVKIALLFWMALIIQIKINPRVRKLLFKMRY